MNTDRNTDTRPKSKLGYYRNEYPEAIIMLKNMDRAEFTMYLKNLGLPTETNRAEFGDYMTFGKDATEISTILKKPVNVARNPLTGETDIFLVVEHLNFENRIAKIRAHTTRTIVVVKRTLDIQVDEVQVFQ